MSRGSVALATVTLVVAAVACTSPTAPDPFADPPEGTLQSTLTPVVGTGEGGTSITSVANPDAYFVATIRMRVRAKPNTTYLVQRAAEIGRENGADGVCQRAEGLAPWSPSDPPFGSTWVTFPLPVATDLKKVTTNGKGEGSLDFEYRSPTIPSGTVFDVQMRLVDDEAAPTSELRSRCMQVVVK
jgi:hypothetical protein